MLMSNDKAAISEIGKEENNNINQEVRSSLGNSIHRNRNTVKIFLSDLEIFYTVF